MQLSVSSTQVSGVEHTEVVGLIHASPERTHGYSYTSCCFIFCCELTARDNLFEHPVGDLFKRSDSGYYCLDLREHGADLHVL
jgi:hypothetical protein